MKAIASRCSGSIYLGFLSSILTLTASCPTAAQKVPVEPSEPHQMLMTSAGFLAIDAPKGWVQRDGPGLAFFLPEGVKSEEAMAWIYITIGPFGPGEDDKDANSYIQSDIAGFKQRFKNGIAGKEAQLFLPEVKQKATVYTFQSGEAHNAFEQVIYIEDSSRLLILTLSSKSSEALARSIEAFRGFAQSYRGSIQIDSKENKPKS